jgi:general secretion pathway protein C
MLITFTIYLGVELFYKALASKLNTMPLSPEKSKHVSKSADQTPRSLSYYQAISRRNLFNINIDTPKAQEKTNPIKIETLKPTGLKLKLWGTVTGGAGKDYAVIESKGGEQNLYRAGDAIQEATVKLILRGKVVLNIGGKDEILEMEEFPSAAKTRTRPGRRPAPRRVSSQRIPLKRSEVENATKNINQLLENVQVRPHFENGQPKGLRLSRIKPNSIFRKMGLINGDVLTAVDGEPIVSVENSLSLYERLRSSDDVKIEIKRRGRIRTIEYRME